MAINNCSVIYEKDQDFGIIEFPNDLDLPKDNALSSRILSNNLEHLSVEQ